MEKEKLVALVTASQQGDNSAKNALFNAFYNDLYYFALKTVKDEELALDITQEAFVEIINTLGNLKEPAAFVTWAKQITYHQCTRYFKKKKDVLVDEDEDGGSIFDDVKEESAEFIPDEALEQDDFKKTILAILDELSDEQRSATMMFYFDEMSIRQIAEIQGVSENTVKSRLNYARKAIKASVEEYEKKNNIKLHAVAILPLFKWLFGGSFKTGISAASAKIIADGVTAATGTAITSAAASATAATAATTATVVGIGAKIADIPTATKIAACTIAAAVVIGGTTTAIVLNNNDGGGSGRASHAYTEFVNNGNNYYDVNCLSVRPKHVYWKDGKLYAECFITNGFSTTAYNINVKSLSFENSEGEIASATFGSVDGLVIAPYSYAEWLFIFEEEHISNYGADLSKLSYHSKTSNSH